MTEKAWMNYPLDRDTHLTLRGDQEPDDLKLSEGSSGLITFQFGSTVIFLAIWKQLDDTSLPERSSSRSYCQSKQIRRTGCLV